MGGPAGSRTLDNPAHRGSWPALSSDVQTGYLVGGLIAGPYALDGLQKGVVVGKHSHERENGPMDRLRRPLLRREG